MNKIIKANKRSLIKGMINNTLDDNKVYDLMKKIILLLTV